MIIKKKKNIWWDDQQDKKRRKILKTDLEGISDSTKGLWNEKKFC